MLAVRRIFAVGVIALSATFLTAPAAQAGFVTYNTTLTTGGPTFNRPNADNPPTSLSIVATSVYYGVQAFYVTTADAYTLETTAAALSSPNSQDTYLLLYQGSFNPNSPLSNALQADDDGGTASLSRFTRDLSVGVQYFLVSTTFANQTTGSITTRIGTTSGGTPTLGTLSSAVPEPSSLALCTVAALAGLGYARRRSRAA